jgi:hypothetical protein
MMLSFAQWLQSTAFFTALRESWYVYPAILSMHMVALSLFGGLILVTDLRLLGMLRKYPVTDVVNSLRPLKEWGFILMVACGLLLFGSKAEEYYYNAFFRTKMDLLFLVFVHASIFRRSVYLRVAEFDATGEVPGYAKLAAMLSLILWLGLLICGRGIGYLDADLNKIHAFLFNPPY